jgi:hypothetical protein
MFEEDHWLPPNQIGTEVDGVSVPRMPQFPIERAAYVYAPGNTITLQPNCYPYASMKRADIRNTQPVTVRIITPTGTGYHHRSQNALVEVVDGGLPAGTRVCLKASDSMYLCPRSLPTIRHPGIFPIDGYINKIKLKKQNQKEVATAQANLMEDPPHVALILRIPLSLSHPPRPDA